ncbi:peptidase M28-like protein [Arthrobacter sp. SLBN-100]|uniref:M28 family metallopeptidase n=1 Tax=Arthrobacter sp. SLBN-100 TaxID=2768450 RepID=UPI001152FED6|nr:M28 family metallopeptidase [Arthrobacter sp. SLBN-100]TQJ67757.1 peptidase M28-like protein [Arthrobacter sp. SLBN-100]
MNGQVPASGCRGRAAGRPRPVLLPRTEAAPLRGAEMATTTALADGVSADTYLEVLKELTAHPTRHSFSPSYRDAAQRAGERLTALGYATREEPVSFGGRQTLNVIAEKPGTAAADERRLVYVVAHLDSINEAGGTNAPAPGADDNASGAAGVLEIARLLAATTARHDLRLVLFGGEEQGLHGSRVHVAGLPAAERSRISMAVNMDMISRLNTAAPSVLLEGAAVSQHVIDALAQAAHDTSDLEVFVSLEPFASDHVSFINAGLPAVLTIEGEDQLNTDEHTPRDTLEGLELSVAASILRMNTAAVAAELGASV